MLILWAGAMRVSRFGAGGDHERGRRRVWRGALAGPFRIVIVGHEMCGPAASFLLNSSLTRPM